VKKNVKKEAELGKIFDDEGYVEVDKIKDFTN
jgi:hypothetical protein